MRERLTTDKTKIFARENPTLMSMSKSELRNHYNEIFDRLQEYEVAEETGQLIVPPCKVGDKVYKITRNKVKECEVVFVGISADERCSYFDFVENYADGTFYKSYSMVFDVIGKSVFLTEKEAKKHLQEGVQE